MSSKQNKLTQNFEKSGVRGVDDALAGDRDPPDAVERGLALLVGLVDVSAMHKSAAFGVPIPRKFYTKDLRHQTPVRRRKSDPSGSDGQSDKEVSGGRGERDGNGRRFEAVRRVAAAPV